MTFEGPFQNLSLQKKEKTRLILENPELGFKTYPHHFCGKEAILVLPSADATWTKENLPYRSVLLEKNTLQVLSCGYPKFFNHGEKPTLYSDPRLHEDWTIQTKIDGSLVICDFINGTFSMRTRGSSSYKSQPNSADFELLPKEYPEVITFLKQNPNLSLLLEIETPQNVIVVRPARVGFTLLDAIDKKTFRLLGKKELQAALPNLPTPKTHPIRSLEELESFIKSWVGLEGVVLSYAENQHRIKLKSDWYRKIHALKSGLNSIDNLLEYYLQKDLPSPEELFAQLEKDADFETAQSLLPLQEKITSAGKLCQAKIQELREFAYHLRNQPRKEQAQVILQNKKEYSSLLFTLLEDPLGKKLEKKLIKKLLEKTLHA